eukprot:gnl/Hemi2/25588_TR8595_c0_g1_i1.p1 gnl/Hemi2/25588_TR8595_c0_g1~~gnl/Hemi2/25588_TR8595_c0_g1_i1.p1  ORF type:complete len:189 (+),score=37.12 gnl/Hemi2/25588_TR8595_c0_g1_i1:79-645(+)
MAARRPRTAGLSDKPAKPPVIRIKILSLGEAGVGKSCLIKRYCEERFIAKYIETIGVDYGVKGLTMGGRDVRVCFWDLAGGAEYFEVRNEFYQDCQGAILVYDITNRKSFEALEEWVQEAYSHHARSFVGVVCANKSDIVGRRAISDEEGRGWATSKGFLFYETSASSSTNVSEMFSAMFTKVLAAAD